MKKSNRKSNHAHHTNHKRANYSMTKKLIIAIISIFVLIIILGSIVFFSDVKEPKQSEAVTALVTTCDSWCGAEAINNWCDFELSASETRKGTCNAFSKSSISAEFGVKNCPAIDCNNRPVIDETCVVGLGGVWEAPTSSGQCEQTGDSQRFLLVPTDNAPVEGQICCSPIEYFE